MTMRKKTPTPEQIAFRESMITNKSVTQRQKKSAPTPTPTLSVENESFTSKEVSTGDSTHPQNCETSLLQKQTPQLSDSQKNPEKLSIENSSSVSTSSVPSFISQLSSLTQAEFSDLITKMKAERCKKSFYEFVKEFIGDVMVEQFVEGKHIRVIADKLQSVTERVSRRETCKKDLIINICPGMTKSTLCSILWPVWCWVADPTISFITASHDQDLANRFANRSRDLIKSDKFKLFFPHIQLKSSQDNKGDYENTMGGYRLSTSSKSSPTGRHGLILMGDDIQNRDGADSSIERQNVNDWYSKTFSSRKADKAATTMVIVQQRLHIDDITGFCLDRNPDGYDLVSLPAEESDKVFPVELRKIYTNGVLDPNRLTPDVLVKERVNLGTKAFETQFNQNPQSDAAAVIKEDWLKPIITKDEFKNRLKDSSPVIEFFADTAYTEKTSNDPSALLACTKIGETLYILNTTTVRLEFLALINYMKTWTEANGYTSRSRITVEPKASGQSVVQILKTQTSLNIKEGVSPKSSKLDRLNAIAPIVECGKVVLVEGHYTDLFLGEVTASSPKHDDLRDVFVMAIETLMVKRKGSGKYCLGIGNF